MKVYKTTFSILPLALAFAGSALGFASTCPNPDQQPLSCSLSGSALKDVDTCCYNTPGGLVLVTQLWNPTGPSDSWGVHGLWPDNCDGSYGQYCDEKRQYKNLTDIVESFDDYDTLSDMKTYWINENGETEEFWEHEWGKHGTCFSTIEVSCYGDNYKPQLEVYEYLKKVMSEFHKHPTYDWLSKHGITPSSEKTYSISQFDNAAEAEFGHPVHWGCDGHTLYEVWYFYGVKGSLIDGVYEKTKRPSSGKSTCPENGIKYLPKSSL